MTTILAAVAVVLFAILIAVCVFGFFLYQQEKWNERKDEINSQPGQYHPAADISSMHPSSVIQTTPFGYSYSGKFNDLYQDRIDYKKRLNRLELEVLDDSELSLVERVKKLEDDVRELNQFYYIPSDSKDTPITIPYRYCKIRFKTAEDAKTVVKAMRTAIDQNGYCSVGRYLELSGGKTIPEDFNYGWTNLNQALLQFVDDDDYPYRLVLPDPEKLDEEENDGLQE